MAEVIQRMKGAFCCMCVQGDGAASSASVTDELTLTVPAVPKKDELAPQTQQHQQLQQQQQELESLATELAAAAAVLDVAGTKAGKAKPAEAEDEEETTLCESTSLGDASQEESNCQATAVQDTVAAGLPEQADQDTTSNMDVNADIAIVDAQSKPAPPAQPDFTGDWLMVRLEGNMDTFMKENGVSFLMRSAASAARFGVGTFKTQVKHADTVLNVVSPLIAGKVYRSSLRIDGTQQEDKDPTDGKRMFVTPCWEADGSTIKCEYRRADTGAVLPTSRRFMVGEEMCIEQTSPGGLTVKRYFERR